MFRLLPAPAGTTAQVQVQPEHVDDRQVVVLGMEGKRYVVLSQRQDDVVTRLHGLCPGCVRRIREPDALRDPDIDHRNTGDERGESPRGGRPCHRVIDSGLAKTAARHVSEIVRVTAEAKTAEALDSSVCGFFRPQVQQRCRILDLTCSVWPCSFSGDDLFLFETGKDTVGQTSGHNRPVGKLGDRPAALRFEQERLCDNAGLPGEARGRSRTRAPSSAVASRLQVQQQAGKFDMHVSQPIDEADTSVFKDASGLRRGAAGDQDRRGTRRKTVGPGDKLMHRCGVGAPFDFDRDRVSGSGSMYDGIRPDIPGLRLGRDDLDSWH